MGASCCVSRALDLHFAASGGDWEDLGKKAASMRSVYDPGYEFPEWSMLELAAGRLATFARDVTVYHRYSDDFEEVRQVAALREPVNLAMSRCYSVKKLSESFGYTWGAYSLSSESRLLPNIAVHCVTPLILGDDEDVRNVHVINVTGYTFDSSEQPDYRYFFQQPMQYGDAKWNELVERFKHMWRYVFECAKRKGLRRILLSDVGGGPQSAFLHGPGVSYARLKDETLGQVQDEYTKDKFAISQLPEPSAAVKYIFDKFPEAVLVRECLLVNAWNPWSLVGNGNCSDNSLDGYLGRSTAMAVLCWPTTNPLLSYESVKG